MGNPRTISSLDEPVRAIMASVSIETGPLGSVRDVVDLLAENDIGAVPVIDKKTRELIGIVGERDVVRVLFNGVDLDTERVGEVMTFSASSVLPTDSIRHATSLMTEGGIRHLPVVDEDNKLMGMLSIRDLLAAHKAIVD